MTKLLRASIIIFIVSFLTQLVVCNHMTVKTKELNLLTARIAAEGNQISEINQRIFLLSSIGGLEARAKELGFAQMTRSVNSVANPTIARAL